MQIRSIDFPKPLVGLAAWSGTGKTTLLTGLLPLLKCVGLRVAVVKHAHHAFEIDRPGKDSFRLRKAGADEILVAGEDRLAWIREIPRPRKAPELGEVLSLLQPEALDVVLVEGFKKSSIPKIELHRPAMGKPLLFPQDPNIVAIATDQEDLPDAAGMPPRLPLDDPHQIAKFILQLIGWNASDDFDVAC